MNVRLRTNIKKNKDKLQDKLNKITLDTFVSLSIIFRWSLLNKICLGIIGRVLFLLSLLPLVLKLISFLSIVGIDDTFEYQLTYLGSILFIFGYILCYLNIPTIIRKYKDLDSYRDWCLQKADIINFNNEFGVLESFEYDKKDLIIFDSIFEHIKEYFPVAEVNKIMNNQRAVMIYATTIFQYKELSGRPHRLSTTLLLLIGIILMYSPIISSAVRLFGG